MKKYLTLCILFAVFAFTANAQIKSCYINKKKLSGLKVVSSDRSTQNNNGQINDTCYLQYGEKKVKPFAEVKVIQANNGQYAATKQQLTDSLQAANTAVIDYNGYRIYEKAPETLVMFCSDDTVVCFHFIKYESQTSEEFKGQRNAFLGEYTAYLQHCL